MRISDVSSDVCSSDLLKINNKPTSERETMAPQSIGLTAFGGYIPRLRLQRKAIAQANAWVAPNFLGKGKGERSMANWDEDAVTMAVEAARDLLGTDDDRSHVDALFFGSTPKIGRASCRERVCQYV